nr:retrovirus-related Pol polyprotein from transposon TNT 1-94 [Tanacetum cinerariifolium]
MFGTVPPPNLPSFGTSTSNTSSPNANRFDTVPLTNDPNNTANTSNVSQSVVDENLPQLLDSRVEMWNDLILAHEGPSDIRDTKIATLRLKFNAFKSLEGEKVNGTFIKLKCLLNDLENNRDYKGKYKGLKAKMVVLTKRINDIIKGKSEKGKNEKVLIAESFNWDDESVSSDDEGTTKVIDKWTCSKVTLDQLLSEQVPGKIIKALAGKGRRKEKISSKEVVFNKADKFSPVLAPEITSDSESESDSQEPLPHLPKLIGAAPFDEYSRCTWVFFLKKKSDAADCMMSFIRKMENLNEVMVKELRSDNGTEFKNYKLEEFCDEKGISQNFSSPCTPEQNEDVVDNRKRDHLEKFDEKANDGFFLGYSLVAKAFRVFNIRRQEMEETVHVTFSEDDEGISPSSTEGDSINFNENKSFPDDEFLEPRSESTQSPSNTEYFPYLPAYENTTPSESPIP